MEELKFKVSSALKDIIGRDLITDDHIAVFELVKNSYDAYATRVDITFENIYSDNSKIIIKDNGKGMSLEDIKNKWLFVAYSAKKEGTEDKTFDYRDNIYKKRSFAGAKGIGRFSCDRLGKELLLESTKKAPGSKTEVIFTDWTQFEKDLREEFMDVSVQHETREESNYGLDHGTVLEITNLRSEWDRKKLLRLKRSLAKLINPAENKSEQNFKIFLNVPEEREEDKEADNYRDRVNGEIQNLIYDTLEIKTTKINSYISGDGKIITTELLDGGTLIYRIKEENQFTELYDISTELFYLNKSAKLTFANRMGLSSKDYGHVFVYKNGFRIYPYGEPGEDPLKIDARKAQGFRRYLGTRDLIGQINIKTDHEGLRETTSRGDGFIQTRAYKQLEDFFKETLFKLENYVVDVQKWGLSIEDLDPDNVDKKGKTFQERISELIAEISGVDNLIDFEYGEAFLEIIEEAQEESTETILSNLEKLAKEKKDQELLKDVNKVTKQLEEFRKAKQAAEKERKEERKKRYKSEQKADRLERQNQILTEAAEGENINFASIEHHINQATYRVDETIIDLLNAVKSDAKIDELVKLINSISLENRKISSLIGFVKKANFDTMSSTHQDDVIQYIDEYINNVYKKDLKRRINRELVDVEIKSNDQKLVVEFVPLELNIILDNLLDNSKSAGASKVTIELNGEENSLGMIYSDNGKGIKPEIKDKIFEFGFTTTDGTGIGMYHIYKLVTENYDGSIKVLKSDNGAKFKFNFNFN